MDKMVAKLVQCEPDSKATKESMAFDQAINLLHKELMDIPLENPNFQE